MMCDKISPYCSNCALFSYSLIPHEHCCFGLYCCDDCRDEAWKKFHLFECKTYPLLWSLDDLKRTDLRSLRLTLLAVYNAGGIANLKQGFSRLKKDPVFKSRQIVDIFCTDVVKSYCSLITSTKIDSFWETARENNAETFFPYLYLLATKNDFFGKKFKKFSDIVSNNDVHFIGALYLINVIPDFLDHFLER